MLHHAVAAAKPGAVIVATMGGYPRQRWGEILTVAAQAKGVARAWPSMALSATSPPSPNAEFPIFSRGLAIDYTPRNTLACSMCPDRAAPVRVAAEQSAVGFSRLILHAIMHARRTRSRRDDRGRSATSARTPYGDRNSLSSSMRRNSLVMRKARASESRRRPCAPSSFQRETSFVEIRPVLAIHFDLAPELWPLVDHFLIDDPDGEQRNQPDHRAQPHGDLLSGRHGQHVVEEIVLIVPEPDALAAHVGHRVGDVEEVLEELDGHVLVDRVVAAPSSMAMRSMLRLNIAIQAVPSDCSMCPPVGSGARAVEHADIVEAEEAALEDVAALAGPCGSPTR